MDMLFLLQDRDSRDFTLYWLFHILPEVSSAAAVFGFLFTIIADTSVMFHISNLLIILSY